MRIRDSQAYRKMDVTRERISGILELREILLSIQTAFSLVNAAVVCAILDSISGLEPSSVITEPRYLKLVTLSSLCPFALISVLVPQADDKQHQWHQHIRSSVITDKGKGTTVQGRSGKCLTEERQILNRWTEYCSELYNYKANGDPSVLNCPQTDTEDNHSILHREIEAAVQSLKKGRSAGVDNIPAELVQAGGEDVITALTTICNKIWQTGEWPTPWTKSLVITSQEWQLAAVPELPHQSPKQSHAEDHTEQIEATSGDDHR